VLGKLSFGGENGGQIQKLYLFWKVNRKMFPKRTLEVDLDNGKASKSGCKQELRIGKSTQHIGEILLSLTKNTLFFA